MDFVIEQMTASHLDAVAQIELESIANPWTKADFASELQNPFSYTIVATHSNIVIGFINTHIICGECTINTVAIHPNYRSNGVAAALLQHYIDDCKRKQHLFITLEVRETNQPAICLYEKFAFQKVGLRKNYYTNPTEDARLYTLTFVGN